MNEQNSQKGKSEGLEVSPKESRFSLRPFLSIASLILILGGVIALWIIYTTWRLGILIGIVLFGFLGIYPLTYIAYRAFREKAQRKRIRDDFRLLGLVSEDELNETVENLYLTVYSPTQFIVYIFLITVFSVVLILGYLYYPAIVPGGTLTLVFFSFLGAYVFSIQELIRRYNTFDIRPQVYSSIFMRLVVASIITFVGSTVIGLSGQQIAGEGANGSSASSSWAIILAFVIGIFPSRGIRWFTQRTNDILNAATDINHQRPLEKIIGISTWHEARLAEMGIDDAQNLATADLRRLLLTTQFDTQEIIHWVDQAILYVKVGEKLDRFRDLKICSFSELRTVVHRLSETASGAMDEKSLQRRADAKKQLASTLGLVDPDELDRLAEFSNYPNYIHIAEYYSRTATVARQRANLAMDILVGAFEETDYNRAVEEAKRLLIQNPNDSALLLRLGTAYYQLDRLDDADAAYTKAIELDPNLAEAYYSRSVVWVDRGDFEKAIRDANDAIHIDPTNARAYNNRGFAYLQKGYFDRALEDLCKALELDDRLAVAYFNRGIAYNSLADFKNANRDFEITYLLGYRSSDLWVSWGSALLGLEYYSNAVDKLSQAVLYDADFATAYAKRGYAYLQLGSKYDYQARSDLETAIRINPGILAAYTNLGLLESRNNCFSEAVVYYNKALELNENHYPTRYNLALAFLKQETLDQAKKEFELILKTAPATSFEAKEAMLYLSRLSAEPEKDGAESQP
ncbi:MAG TPA: tetratricopeptide repeat protein [Anaerolineales bacterium]|nr:tetratricopeptide repeat protein [Anaerolineales bacterium]